MTGRKRVELRMGEAVIVFTLTQMPHPMQRVSEIAAILSAGVTSMQSLPAEESTDTGAHHVSWVQFPCHTAAGSHSLPLCSPILTTGQDFLHSWRHFLGLHRSLLTIAILVNLSCVFPPPSAILGWRREKQRYRNSQPRGCGVGSVDQNVIFAPPTWRQIHDYR